MPTNKSDVIHADGCVFCGRADPPFTMTRAPYFGVRWCESCDGIYPTVERLDYELSRRKSAPSPLPEFRAKVGDRVALAADWSCMRKTVPAGSAGEVTHDHGNGLFAVLLDDVALRSELFGNDGAWMIGRRYLRPAPHPVESIPDAPHAEKTSEEAVCTCCHSAPHNNYDLSGNSLCDACYVRGCIGGESARHAHLCLGKRLPTETKPAPSGGASGQSKADPYAEHDFVDEGPKRTDRANSSRRTDRVAALNASPNPLDRLAAKRAAVLADIDRPSVTHDKMGRPIARWVGWCSTRHERKM